MKTKQKKAYFCWEWLSTYRDELFGIAILSIMFFHFTEGYWSYAEKSDTSMPFLLRLYHKDIGSIGVEWFLFLSGMGLYYAWTKKKGSSLSFYAKRIKRILMVYVPVGLIYFGFVDLIFKPKGFVFFLKDFTLYSFFEQGEKVVWYIALILLLYLAFPLFYKIIYWNKRANLSGLLLLAALNVLSVVLLVWFHPELYDKIEIALTRVLIFLVGVYAGEKISDKKRWNWQTTLLFVAGTFVLKYLVRENLVSDYCDRYFVAAYGVGLLVILCVLLKVVSVAWLHKFLIWVGSMSLELYLTHVTLRKAMRKMGYQMHEWQVYLVMIGIAFVLSVLLHYLIQVCTKTNRQKRK